MQTVEPPLRATTHSAGTRYERARGDDIIQPKAPPRKGEGLLCPSVPRAKDRARPDVDPCAPPRPPLTPLARFLIGARLCACVYPSNVGVRTRTTLLLSSRPRSRVLRILRGYFWWRPVAVLYERALFSSPRPLSIILSLYFFLFLSFRG